MASVEHIQVQTATLMSHFQNCIGKYELEFYPRKEAVVLALADTVHLAQKSNWEITFGLMRYLVLTKYGLTRKEVVEIGKSIYSPVLFKAFIQRLEFPFEVLKD